MDPTPLQMDAMPSNESETMTIPRQSSDESDESSGKQALLDESSLKFPDAMP